MKQLFLYPALLTLATMLLITAPSLAQAGHPDPGFSGDGFVTASFMAESHAKATAVAVQPDGKIVAAGAVFNASMEEIALVRYKPDGNPDQTFSGDGKLTIAAGTMMTYATAMVIQADGKILVAGGAYTETGPEEFVVLFRLNADGSPDNSFDGDGMVITSVGNGYQAAEAIALQPDGKIVLAGYAEYDYDNIMVLRYHSNGTPDFTFDGDGIALTPVGDAHARANAVIIQPDGKIVAAGYAMSNGYKDFAAVRYHSNGSLDNSFSADGKAQLSITGKDDRALGAALQTDGKIVLAGQSGAWQGTNFPDMNFAAIRFTADGDPDPAFSDDGIATASICDNPEGARAVVLQPDGQILLAGFADNNPQLVRNFALVRFTVNGVLDNSFDGDGLYTTPPVQDHSRAIFALALQPDGKIVAAGYDWFADYSSFAVARFFSGLTVGTADPGTLTGPINVYPNPLVDRTTLEYELKENETVAVNLYDAQGRLVQNLLTRQHKTAGNHAETFQIDGELPPGLYLLAIESEHGTVATSVVK